MRTEDAADSLFRRPPILSAAHVLPLLLQVLRRCWRWLPCYSRNPANCSQRSCRPCLPTRHPSVLQAPARMPRTCRTASALAHTSGHAAAGCLLMKRALMLTVMNPAALAQGSSSAAGWHQGVGSSWRRTTQGPNRPLLQQQQQGGTQDAMAAASGTTGCLMPRQRLQQQLLVSQVQSLLTPLPLQLEPPMVPKKATEVAFLGTLDFGTMALAYILSKMAKPAGPATLAASLACAVRTPLQPLQQQQLPRSCPHPGRCVVPGLGLQAVPPPPPPTGPPHIRM